MKQLNQIISMYIDNPNGVRSLRGQVKCRAAGYLRLHLCQQHKEPEVPTIDIRNELDFEREAREMYEAGVNIFAEDTSPYRPADYLGKAKSYTAVLLETMAAKIYDTNTLQDSIDFMCKQYKPSDKVLELLTPPELEVQKLEHEEQVISWRKHEVDICTTINDWMTSDALIGSDYPENLPEMLQKAVVSMFSGLRSDRVKTVTGKLKGDRALTKESYEAGLLDLTALQNSF